MKKRSAPLAFVLSVVLIESFSVVAQSNATPAERPLIERIQGRTFPSVFQAWSPAQNMECTESKTAQDWKRIADTLAWAEVHLREPRVNCLETWFHESRDDLNLIRATTSLALTHSDGYCLFSDPNPLATPDHLHNWYAFWNTSLGKPVAKGTVDSGGTVRREFENGTVVYNPMGNNAISVTFPEDRRSAASGKTAQSHHLESSDGDMFLKVK